MVINTVASRFRRENVPTDVAPRCRGAGLFNCDVLTCTFVREDATTRLRSLELLLELPLVLENHGKVSTRSNTRGGVRTCVRWYVRWLVLIDCLFLGSLVSLFSIEEVEDVELVRENRDRDTGGKVFFRSEAGIGGDLVFRNGWFRGTV